MAEEIQNKNKSKAPASAHDPSRMLSDIYEIREGLADHENRILWLEGSLPSPESKSIQLDTKDEYPWTQQQWEYVKQLEGRVLYLQNKLNEHLDSKRRKKDVI